MLRKISLLCLVIFLSTITFAVAQPPANSQLEPKPYNPETDPNIDMFIGHWKESMPRHIHGSLVVRDILTRLEGDPLRPAKKGAVLIEVNSISYAVLDVNASTAPSMLKDEQEIFYIMSGKGIVKSGGKTAELHEGIAFVIAPDIEFTMTNTGDEPLTMYLVSEPVPEGFKPNKELVVKNEFDNSQGITVHWANIDRGIIGGNDGVAVYSGLTAVKIDPMTMAQPHSHGVGVEEVWIALKGDIKLLMGKQLRILPVGSAYKVPADGNTPHANINLTGTQVKLIHMMKNVKSETGPYSQLDPKLFDPKVDPNIDMFMGSWKESMPRNIYGSLVERDILTSLDSDPLKPVARGAVMTDLKGFTHATLEPLASTKPAVLEDEQKTFYIVSGTGTISAGNKTASLYKGIGILLPPDIEFTMTSTGDSSLEMYIITEPIPEGFTPNKEIRVTDENVTPFHTTTGHWCHMSKRLFKKEDGLAILVGMGPVWFDPMTMGQPHSHGEGVEEIWFSLEGDVNILLGKQLRKLPPGMAYKIPPNGTTPHSTINKSDKQIKTFWLMKVAR